jgi:hypothetical protein
LEYLLRTSTYDVMKEIHCYLLMYYIYTIELYVKQLIRFNNTAIEMFINISLPFVRTFAYSITSCDILTGYMIIRADIYTCVDKQAIFAIE